MAQPAMREFASISEYLTFLEGRMAATRVAQREGLHAAGDMLVHEARATIGEYQKGVGPFRAWEPLTEATLYGGVSPEGHPYPGKVELGYAPPDNPLLRTGQMRGSIEQTTNEHEVILGSHDPVAVEHEFGTRNMPARPFIGATMFRHAHEAVDIVVRFIMAAFCGDPKPHISNHASHQGD